MAGQAPKRTVGVSLKMYFNLESTAQYIRDCAPLAPHALSRNVDIFIIPDFLSLTAASTTLRLEAPTIRLGAQDCFWEDNGAYTGEVSPVVLKHIGCSLVELGHAERRRLFGETDAQVAKKAKAAVRNGMTPLVCIGEKTKGTVEEAVAECRPQIESILEVTEEEIIFAYEPVWAIGQPKPASAEYVVSVAKELRKLCGKRPVFASIPAGLAQYKDKVEFVLGAASALDPTSKTVTISTASGERQQTYDILVLATGSRANGDVPWKSSLAGYEATRDGLHKFQEQVKVAKSIVIGGAGPTGVETAGELGFEYGKNKEITLITAGPQLLVGVPPHVASFAENDLKKLHVKLLKGTKITNTSTSSTGQTELTLSNGDKVTVDLYLPTIGLLPNTEYVPKKLLNEKGDVMVDQFLRVKGVESVWAAGDIVDCQPGQFVYTEKQAAAVAKNLDLVLKGKQAVAYKSDGDPMLAVALGRSRGTGRFGNMKLPSLVVWLVKGRNMGMPKQSGLVMGTAF
ncbi:putative triosephosphate isomerase [Hyaloscypha variabilis F]|uniref:triose-phosphate isomerase n=1 Tax=Hyaloscypha variabilis (strain UAMH 11265 / GT02V1 / F) TaxID=1149755 RepID=A0A2J6S9X7_HYAVF|nr:putative triosephosphate isomerase [Hyaloscypha variabilis F]